jgi:hypothetical protein
MKKFLCAILTVTLFLGSATFNPTVAQETEDDIVKNTQQDITLVGVAAAGGVVLGLSTLSFMDKPSQHVSNIWTGAALGIIAGVIFVAYMSAQKNSEELQSSRQFNSSERVAWHNQNVEKLTHPQAQFGTSVFQFRF